MGWVFSLFNTKTSSSDAQLMEACVTEQLIKHLELRIWRSGVQASPVVLFP